LSQEDVKLVTDEAKQAMEKTLHDLQKDLAKIRTGRANTQLIESVMVDYYGSMTPLKALATLSAPEARLMVVQPFDPIAMNEIERAIQKSDLGISPVSDGKVLRLPIPELTGDRRKAIIKSMKGTGEDHKVAVRNARRDAINMLKQMEKDGDVTEDESRKGQTKVQELTDEFTKKVDQMMAAKEAEILQI
jgi:ribosome recycling factor